MEYQGHKIHILKTLSEYFEQVWVGNKNFELRKNDRGFQLGDFLYLYDYNPDTVRQSGLAVIKRASYVLMGGNFGLNEDYVIMSLEDVPFDVSLDIESAISQQYNTNN